MKTTVVLGWLFLCAGCGNGGIQAPYVPEPASGTVLDRCLVRVRMTQPWYNPGGDTPMATGTDTGIHADYRVNGGPQIPVDNYVFVSAQSADYRKFAPFMFAATLVPGANHFEVGSCDSVDACQFTPSELTVNLAPGSPDPVFGGGGQTVVPGYDAGFHLLPLADGRSLVSVEAIVSAAPQIGIVRLRKDGVIDTLFGKRGFSPLGNFSGQPFIAPVAGGGYLVVVRGMREVYGKTWLARLDEHGNLDMKVGMNGLLPIALPGVGPFIDVQALASDGAGNVVAAGIAADAAHGNGAAPVVFQMSPDGTVLASSLLAKGDAALRILGASVDAKGNAALLATDRVFKGSAKGGADVAFGGAGVVMLPKPVFAAGVTLTATGVAVVQAEGSIAMTGVTVLDLSASGAITPIAIPWASSVMASGAAPKIAAAPDGTIYIAATIAHPANVALSFTDDMTPGADLALARLQNGSLDKTFGENGIAHASLMLSWTPPAIDTLIDTPTEIVFGPDGAPYVVASSASASTQTMLTSTKRGPGFGIVRFLR